MSANVLQRRMEKNRREKQCFETENSPGMKFIVICQVCIRCGQEFSFKQGRKSCPQCSGLLIAKTMIRKRF